MHQLTNNIKALLNQLSAKLPQVTVHSTEKRMIKGSEILSWHTIKEIDGMAIDENKWYKWNYPVITCANHYRRLKNAYKKSGITGVQEYLNWIIKLQKKQKVSNVMVSLEMILKTIAQQK